MERRRSLSAALTVAIALGGGTALAQTKTAGCAGTPAKVEGQVLKVDLDGGKVTIRESNGTTHEFQASRETLQGYKVGDRIEAKLRELPPGCK